MEEKMKKVWELEAKVSEFDHFCRVSKDEFLLEVQNYRKRITELDATSKNDATNPVLYDTIWICIHMIDGLLAELNSYRVSIDRLTEIMKEFYYTIEVVEKLLA